MMIDVKHLIKRFGSKTVLRGLDFHAGEGEFVAVLGPNGAGKTTFLRILSSLARSTDGEVSVAGWTLPQEAAAVRRSLGVVSHLPLLYGELSAEGNLRFYGRLYSVAGLEARVSEVFALIGLTARRKDLVRTFSRGMQQRLAIGRAILHDPRVLLLDEPYTGLDQEACDMLDGILVHVGALGRTVVMTSHDLSRTEGLASRFDVISNGRIAASIHKENLPQDGLQAFYRKALSNGGAS